MCLGFYERESAHTFPFCLPHRLFLSVWLLRLSPTVNNHGYGACHSQVAAHTSMGNTRNWGRRRKNVGRWGGREVTGVDCGSVWAAWINRAVKSRINCRFVACQLWKQLGLHQYLGSKEANWSSFTTKFYSLLLSEYRQLVHLCWLT